MSGLRTHQEDEKIADAEEDPGGLGEDQVLLHLWTGEVNPGEKHK